MQRILTTLGSIALGLAVIGCAPKYPKCDKDEHCRRGEFCVNGLCQQCRADADCPEGQKCEKGRCEARAACTDDASCGPGMKCESGKCVKAAQCQTDGDCPAGSECQQGKCVAPPRDPVGKMPCDPEPVYFDFNEHILTLQATNTLKNQAAPCIKRVPARKVRIEGHCDSRGTDEYNLAFGDRRARSVKTYLDRLGIPGKKLKPVSKGKLEAAGSDEAGWSRDRRAHLVWD